MLILSDTTVYFIQYSLNLILYLFQIDFMMQNIRPSLTINILYIFLLIKIK